MIKIRRLVIRNEEKDTEQESKLNKVNRLLILLGGGVAYWQTITKFISTDIILHDAEISGLNYPIFLLIGLILASLAIYTSLKPHNLIPPHFIALIIFTIFFFAFRLPISAIIILIAGIIDVIDKIV